MTPTTDTDDRLLIDAYAPLREQVDNLAKAEGDAAFDYDSPEGNKAARSHVHSLRKVKGQVERVRKVEKADVLERGRQIDAQARALIEEVDGMIARHAAELARIEAAEEARVSALNEKMSGILSLTDTHDPETGEPYGSNYLLDRLAAAREMVIDAETFAELAPQAEQARESAVNTLNHYVSKTMAHEAEQAELARLREEAEARRLEDEARVKREAEARAEEERKTREQRIAAEAAEKAARDAKAALEDQQRQHEAELLRQREESEREAREAREALERKAAAEKAERDRVERERLEAEAKEAAELKRRQEDREHRATINREVVAALVAKCGGDLREEQAQDLVRAVALGEIPHVTISY